MAAKELIMEDEGINIKGEEHKTIAVVIPKNLVIENNIVIMPLAEALSLASNITIQVAMLL